MTHFVLIFMLITGGVGSFGYTAEFNDKEACENALEVIQRTRVASLDEHYNGYLVANCFPKSSH